MLSQDTAYFRNIAHHLSSMTTVRTQFELGRIAGLLDVLGDTVSGEARESVLESLEHVKMLLAEDVESSSAKDLFNRVNRKLGKIRSGTDGKDTAPHHVAVPPTPPVKIYRERGGGVHM